MCDHPGSTAADYREHLTGVIERYGWAVQHVEGGRVRPPWAYSVGLTPCSLPEIVVTGLAERPACRLINHLVTRFLDDGFPDVGAALTLIDGRAGQVVAVPHPEAHLRWAVALFGDAHLEAIQVVWGDDRGRWPWERGFRGRRGGQPVLGPRAP